MLPHIIAPPQPITTSSFFNPGTLSPTELSEDSPSLQIPQYPKKAGKWTIEEDNLLRKYVELCGEKQWRKISHHIPGRTSIQCLHRWSKILRPGLVKGPWTAEEDQRLVSWVQNEGPNKWAQAANYILGRSGKQCRERWFNNLSPDVKKGDWSKEEDEQIFDLYQKHGSSWSKIAKFVQGRTENSIKNRFYSTLRKLNADKKKTKATKNLSDASSTPTDGEEVDEDVSLKETDEMINSANMPNTLYKLLQEQTQIDKEHDEEDVSGKSTEPDSAAMSGSVFSKFESKQRMNSESSGFIIPEEKSANSMVSRSAISLCSERPLINKVLLERKASEDSVNSPILERAVEKDESNVNKFERLLVNMNKRIHDNFISNNSEPFQNSEDTTMKSFMQKKLANYNNIIAKRSQSDVFKSFNNDFSSQSATFPRTCNNREPFSPNPVSLLEFQSPVVFRESLSARRTDTHDLSNPVGFKLDEINSASSRVSGSGLISKLPPLKMPYAFKSNISSPMTPLNFSPAPKYSYYSNKLSSFSSNSSQFENYKILQALQSRKEVSHGSQASVYNVQTLPQRANAEQNNEGKTKEALLGMIQTINKASNVQQNCFSSLLDVMKVAPNNQETEPDDKMSQLYNQLNSLESLFTNVKGQLIKLETSLKDISANRCQTEVKIEADEVITPGKRVLENMMSQIQLDETDQVVKKVKL